jgi:drug/metabolite transporter (DMT)-like permease
MVLSALAFAFMTTAVKFAWGEATNIMIVFFRNAFSLVLLLPWALASGPRSLATRHLGGHLVRGLSGVTAVFCFFFAVGHMRLADATLLNCSFPLFLPVAEWVHTRQPVAPGVWRSLLLGFAGVLFILKPGSDLFSSAAMIGLLSAVFAAIAQTGVRHLTHTEPVTRIVFYFGLIASLASGAVLPFDWRTPSMLGWTALLATGAFATIGQLTLTRAYVHAPAALAGPFIYSGVVFAALMDWLIWRNLPDALFIPGAMLVVAAGAWMLRHEPSTPASPPVDLPG